MGEFFQKISENLGGKRGETLQKILLTDFRDFLSGYLKLDAGCYRLYLEKSYFTGFEIRPPKMGGRILGQSLISPLGGN
jgi:hypothetical protein